MGINKIIGNISRRRWKPETHKELKPEVLEFFRDNDEGLYYTNMRSGSTNCVSRAIRRIAGEETHCTFMLYDENIKEYLCDLFKYETWEALEKKYNFYYGNSCKLEDVKVLTLASAEKIGMVYADFSKYQNREQSIRKVQTSFGVPIILCWLMTIMNCEYDYSGLAFWKYHLWDDPNALFCSETIEEGLRKINLRASVESNPSPHDLELYNLDWIVKPMGRGGWQ